MNAVHWIHLLYSQKRDFLNLGYLYSDCAYSSSRDPFEIKLLEEFWQEFTVCIKLKFVVALVLLSVLVNFTCCFLLSDDVHILRVATCLHMASQ